MTPKDEYTSFRDESEQHRQLLLQEELILDVTEAIAAEMDQAGLLKKDLAERLGKTKGYVSQLLGGGRNLTLRTLSDIADALKCRVDVRLRSQKERKGEVLQFPTPDSWSQERSEEPRLKMDFSAFETSDVAVEAVGGA